MKPTTAALAALLVFAAASPSIAQNDFCNRNALSVGLKTYDPDATKVWREMVARQDNELMARMTGLWYAEIPNIGGSGMNSFQYRQYEANGIWDYQSDTCAPGWPCSKAFGTGFWTAQPASDGSIKMFFILSDLERDHACFGGAAWLVDDNTMTDGAGATWRRVDLLQPGQPQQDQPPPLPQ